MNLPTSNSGGSAGLIPPPPPISFFLILPDGSCIPATPETCKIIMKQARSEARKLAKAKRKEIAAELQLAREFRREERVLLRELAEMGRGHMRWARFKVDVRPERPATRTSPVKKRWVAMPMQGAVSRIDGPREASSWVVDDFGMRGVIWQQSYLGRNTLRTSIPAPRGRIGSMSSATKPSCSTRVASP